MKELFLNVEGMSCSHCEARISNALKGLENIKEVNASAKDKSVVIFYEDLVNMDQIKEVIEDTGYKVK